MKKIIAMLLTIGLILCLYVTAQANEPALTIGAAVERFLQEAMAAQADNASGGWERYIFNCGASNITMELGKFDVTRGKPLAVSFMLASGNPRIKEQPKYTGDAQAFLSGIVQSMSTPDTKVKVNLAVTNVSSGYVVTFAPKAEAALQKAVKTAAASAKKAFADKKVLSALTDFFMPAPIAIPKKAPVSLKAGEYLEAYVRYLDRADTDEESRLLLPALLYSIKDCRLDISGGPEAIALTFNAPDLFELIEDAGNDVQYDMRYDARAKAYTREQLTLRITARVEQKAIAHRHSKDKGTAGRYEFNLFDLDREIDAFALISANHDSAAVRSKLESAVDDTSISIGELPDYPAVASPKSGLVSGRNTGTKCIFHMPKDGLNYCIGVYSASSDKQILVAFSNNGSRVTVRIPQGLVYFIIGEGETWYGQKHLFGETGSYMKTENIDIYSSRYYHTFTVKPKGGGNTDTYPLDYSDLFR